MKAIGLDIGTTTICGVVIDTQTGAVLHSQTLPNDTVVTLEPNWEKKQDPNKIWNKICDILRDMNNNHPDVACIGMTGQMHGVVYLDKDGIAVSPLYTWQDESGNQIEENDKNKTYAQCLTEKTGYFAASGFGLTTVYYHAQNNMIPVGAAKICTIMDYVGMRLCGDNVPVMSPSNAASFGVYNTKDNSFDYDKLNRAGIDVSLLPEVISETAKIGEVNENSLNGIYKGVPVSVALGDNQASVIGTVKNIYDTVLVNVGTGSQISVGTKKYISSPVVELRPLTGSDYIYAGSCLCGGRAYAALERFFRQVLTMAGVDANDKLYGYMANALLCEENNHFTDADELIVDPRFCGTRENPAIRGSITNISLDNLTPESFIRGFLKGEADELHGLYEKIVEQLGKEMTYLVGSGNGIRMNPILQEAFEKLFGMKLVVPAHKEEAAYGTALFSMVAAGIHSSLEEAQKLIQYV